MEERDLKAVEAVLRVTAAGKVMDLWPHHGPFYRPQSKKKQPGKAALPKEMAVNKAHLTPEHMGEKIDFKV